MRWFASFWITAALCGVAAALFTLRAADVPLVSSSLKSAFWFRGIPPILTFGLVFGCWAVVRGILQKILAYTASAVDASPRARPGKRAALGALADRWFSNPRGAWIAPYLFVLTIVAVLAWPVGSKLQAPPVFPALTALYVATLAGAMAMPDRRQPLRIAADPPPDPLLAMPGDVAPAD